MANSAHSKSKKGESEMEHLLRNCIFISQHNSTTKHKSLLHKVPSGKLQDYRKKKICYFLFLLSYSNFLLSENMCNSAHSKSKMC